MRQLTDRPASLAPARARTLFAAVLLALAGAGSLSTAFAIEVKAKPAPPDLAPFVGTWIGYLPGDTATPREPAVELTVSPSGRVELTMVRRQRSPEGATITTRVGLPVAEPARVEGGLLAFRTRVESFAYTDWPPGPAETTWTLDLQLDGRALLASGDNSYFAAAKSRGQEVPPPPPPTLLERQ